MTPPVTRERAHEPTNENAATKIRAPQWTRNVVACPDVRPTSLAKMPVISMPTMPPTPWHGNTSSVSSSVDLLFFQCTIRFDTTLAEVPMKMLSPMLTKPAAGVIATSPTTAPTHAPSADGLLPRMPSKKIHASAAAADAVFVVAKAIADARAERGRFVAA